MVKRALNKGQIRLVQTAVRAAGLREPHADGRYRLLLAQYKRPDGQPCASCTDLNRWQMDDLLAICEGMGWRHPNRKEDHYRTRARRGPDTHWATPAQVAAITHLAGDLGWTAENLNGMLGRMTNDECRTLADLTSRQAFVVIEALKAMLSRKDGKSYKTLADVEEQYNHEKHEGSQKTEVRGQRSEVRNNQ